LAVVADERLAALRSTPEPTARLLRRLNRGHFVSIRGASRNRDGLVFYHVVVTRRTSGWLQSEAVIASWRPGDDRRLARLIGGGKVRSVRAMAGVGDPLRPGEGHYTGYLEFEDGAAASLVYSGYAYFDSAELVWGLGEGGELKDPERHLKARQFFRRLRVEPSQQKALDEKLEQWRYGGSSEGQWTGESSSREKRQPFFGLTVVTCEKGDIRQSPDGLFIYDEDGKREIHIPKGIDAREAELQEFYEGIVDDRPIFHDGRWGQATLEVCLAILQSAAERREVSLSHQVPVPNGG